MTPTTQTEAGALDRKILQAFEAITGPHPGFRPAHAKGILLSGSFVPAVAGTALTSGPHLHRGPVPVTVRFSDFAGIPAIPDTDPNASPRGLAIRFHLAEHSHTDIVAHSVNGFPARTAEGFVQFLEAIAASGPDAPHPNQIEKYLAANPAALAFVQAPKPDPCSFAQESYFAVNAYRFTNSLGAVQFGRYRILPVENNCYLTTEEAKSKSKDFLFDEIKERIQAGEISLRIVVQLAEAGDTVDDSTIAWPETRTLVEFGTLSLTGLIADNDAEQRHIIFDPVPRVEGIDPSNDPLIESRASVYLASGRQRRKANPQPANL